MKGQEGESDNLTEQMSNIFSITSGSNIFTHICVDILKI